MVIQKIIKHMPTLLLKYGYIYKVWFPINYNEIKGLFSKVTEIPMIYLYKNYQTMTNENK